MEIRFKLRDEELEFVIDRGADGLRVRMRDRKKGRLRDENPARRRLQTPKQPGDVGAFLDTRI